MTQFHSPDASADHEAVSALADGMLSDDAFEAALAQVTQDAAASAAWYRYHAIGDALRAPQAPLVPAHDAAFVARFRQRLALELAAAPDATAAAPMPTATSPQILPVPAAVARQPAANDGLWRWRLVAGLASLSTAAVLAWAMGFTGDAGRTAPTLAQAGSPPVTVAAADARPAPVAVNSPNGLMLRDPVLDELLAAHHQLGGNSALQMPAGFLRNATFEGAAR